jgi:hypothetical protein
MNIGHLRATTRPEKLTPSPKALRRETKPCAETRPYFIVSLDLGTTKDFNLQTSTSASSGLVFARNAVRC